MKKNLLFIAAIVLISSRIISQVPTYVPTSSLVSWYGFNGNANDLGPAANNGTVYGSTLTTDRFSNTNSAYDFDGISNFISAGTVTAYNSDDFSISFWTNRGADFGTNWIITCGGNNNYLWSAMAGAGAFRLGVGDGCLGSGMTLLYNTTANWHMITYTQSGTVQTIYVDAVNQATAPNTLMSSVTCEHDSLHIGCDWAQFPQYFTGKIDDIGIWNRVLNDCEVEKLYLAGLPAFATVSSSTLLCVGQTATLTAGGASNYTWTPGNLTGSAVAVSPTTTTIYTCVATSTISGCAVSKTFTQNVSPCTGIQNYSGNSSELKIFPNPSNGEFSIYSVSAMQIEIYNITGEKVKNFEVRTNETMSIKGLRPGVYFIRTESGNYKVMVE